MKSQVGLADLVRLRASLSLADCGAAASLLGLGFGLRPDSLAAREQAEAPAAMREVAEAEAREAAARDKAILARPVGVVRDTSPSLFFRLERMTFVKDEARPPVPGGLVEQDFAPPTVEQRKLPRAPSLAPWSRLGPVLRRMLRRLGAGRAPDVRALLRKLGRGEVLGRIPRVRRDGWSREVSVWVDRTRRLKPFWDDQSEVFQALEKLIGRFGLRPRILDDSTQALSIARTHGFVSPGGRRREGLVLVLSDLGMYGSSEERAAWLLTARRLCQGGARVVALVPVPRDRWDRTLTSAWCAETWERGRRSAEAWIGGETHAARAARLLQTVSPAMLVQPGLLRAIRLLLPSSLADAGTGADAWNHPDAAWHGTKMVLRGSVAASLREAFAKPADGDEEAKTRDAEQKRGVAELMRRWHEDWPQELRHAETLMWCAHGLDRVAEPPGDIAEALAFAKRLEGSVRSSSTEADLRAALRRFGQAWLDSMPEAAYEGTEQAESLRYVWGLAFEGVSGVAPPPGFDRAKHAGPGSPPTEVTHWGVRQVGRRLVFSRSSGAWPSSERGPGSPLAWLEAGGRDIDVFRGGDPSPQQFVLRDQAELELTPGERLRLKTDRCEVTIDAWAWKSEGWAQAAGRDRFGLWADVEVGSVVQRFRWIPPGRFWMGSPEGEEGSSDDERPRHRVTWTDGRWLADTPVTQALWSAVVKGANPSRFEGKDRPVEEVTWNDCQVFVKELGKRAQGLEPRLPSEAEWEHACRGGTETATWVGDLVISEGQSPQLDSIAWYSKNSGGETHEVAKKDPNPLGLYDMLGNVWEWCMDKHSSYVAGDDVDPRPKDVGTGRVFRGGSWFSAARDVRAAIRFWDAPGLRSRVLGFRLARGRAPGPAQEQEAEPRARSVPLKRDKR